jgi:hypothetical protein
MLRDQEIQTVKHLLRAELGTGEGIPGAEMGQAYPRPRFQIPRPPDQSVGKPACGYTGGLRLSGAGSIWALYPMRERNLRRTTARGSHGTVLYRLRQKRSAVRCMNLRTLGQLYKPNATQPSQGG